MAANVPAPSASGPTTKPSPLSSFDQVSRIVYFHQPATTTPAVPGARNPSGFSSSPKLILLGGWMDAQPAHLAKYTTKLQALFPTSPILLVRAFAYHFVTGTANFSAEIAPAVPIIRSIFPEAASGGDNNDDSGSRRPEMLVMVFSNGGSTTLRYLYQLIRKTAAATPKGAAPHLPPHLTLFDSAPGGFSYGRSVTAFTLSAVRRTFLVRLWVAAVSHLMAAFYWVATVPWGRPGFLERLALAHNLRDGENRAEVARAYVYSKEDALVDWRFVEGHAAQARERGFEVVLERFEGTAHVAHARGDEGRYWKVVRDFWDQWAAV